MPGNRSPRSLRLLLSAAGVFYAIFIARTGFRAAGLLRFTLLDDAMISMRYAHHLAVGMGLVWNAGETPIEGFTNPGWTLIMAGLHGLPIPSSYVPLGIMLLSAVLLLLNSVVGARLCEAIDPDARYAPLMAAALIAFNFPLVFWSLRGMEVGLIALLVDLAALLLVRSRRLRPTPILIPALLLAGAIVVRLDAAIQVAVVLGYTLVSKQDPRSRVWPAILIGAAAVAGVLIFQKVYFGDPLPNTFYLKMTGGAIGERVKHGVLAFITYAARDVLIVAIAAAVGLWHLRRLRSLETILLTGLFAVQCAYSIWIGGDYAEPEVAAANRFIAQGMPALFVLFSLASDGILSSIIHPKEDAAESKWPTPDVLSLGLASMVLLLVSGIPWLNWARFNAPLLQSDIRRVRAGLAIANNTSPEAVIAVHAAGQIPYYSDRRTIDMLGLNDPVIAHGLRSTSFYPGHDKWNYEHSIARLQPDLIADNWIRLAEYMKRRQDYRKLPNGMYLRVDSKLVDENGLLRAFP